MGLLDDRLRMVVISEGELVVDQRGGTDHQMKGTILITLGQ